MNQLNKYDFYLIRFLRVFLRVFSCYYIFTCREYLGDSLHVRHNLWCLIMVSNKLMY